MTDGNAAGLLAAVDFSGGRLRLVQVSRSRVDYGGSSVLLHLEARRADGRGPLVILVSFEGVTSWKMPSVGPGRALAQAPVFAFTEAGEVRMRLLVGDAVLSVTASSVSWYPDGAFP